MIQAATAPVIIGLFYIYIRDKYEKEPWQMLLWGLLFGVYATFVIYGVGQWVEAMFPLTDLPFAAAFLQAALVEESVKLLFLLALLAWNPQYNEPFDSHCIRCFHFFRLCMDRKYCVCDPSSLGWHRHCVGKSSDFYSDMDYMLCRWDIGFLRRNLQEEKLVGSLPFWYLICIMVGILPVVGRHSGGRDFFGTAYGTAYYYRPAPYGRIAEKIPISSHRRKIVPKTVKFTLCLEKQRKKRYTDIEWHIK